MMVTYQTNIKKFTETKEANAKALKLAKEILSEEEELTPGIVAEFLDLSGYPDIEVFIHTTDGDEDPFNYEDEYEDNIYYYLFETGDITRVDYEELTRLAEVHVEFSEKGEL